MEPNESILVGFESYLSVFISNCDIILVGENMDKKEELRLKLETWAALDNDGELYEEIKKLGQEKYAAICKIHNYYEYTIDGYSADHDKIYFSAYDGDCDISALKISIDELFMDIEEWVKIKKEEFKKAEEIKKKNEEEKKKAQEIAFQKGEYKLYLELKEKFENKYKDFNPYDLNQVAEAMREIEKK